MCNYLNKLDLRGAATHFLMAYKNKNEQQNWIYADLLLVHLVIILVDFENVKQKITII